MDTLYRRDPARPSKGGQRLRRDGVLISVDLKSWHGYPVSAGSPHAKTGQPYRLIIEGVELDIGRLAGPVTDEVRDLFGRVRAALRDLPTLRASQIDPFLGGGDIEGPELDPVVGDDFDTPDDTEEAARWALVEARVRLGGRDMRMACPWCRRGGDRVLRVRPGGRSVYCHQCRRAERRRRRAPVDLAPVDGLLSLVLAAPEVVPREELENAEEGGSVYASYRDSGIPYRTNRPKLDSDGFRRNLKRLFDDMDPAAVREALDGEIAALLGCAARHYGVETYVGCERAAFVFAAEGGSTITRHLATCGSLRCPTCGPSLLAAGLAAWRGYAEAVDSPEVEAVMIETSTRPSVARSLRTWAAHSPDRDYYGLRVDRGRVIWILSANALDMEGRGVPALIEEGVRGSMSELAALAARQVDTLSLAEISGDIHLFRGPARGVLADIRDLLIRRPGIARAARDGATNLDLPRRPHGVRLFTARRLEDLEEGVRENLLELATAMRSMGDAESAEALVASRPEQFPRSGAEVEMMELGWSDAEDVFHPESRHAWTTDEHLHLPAGVDAASLLRAARGVGLTPPPGKGECPWTADDYLCGGYYSMGLAS